MTENYRGQTSISHASMVEKVGVEKFKEYSGVKSMSNRFVVRTLMDPEAKTIKYTF